MTFSIQASLAFTTILPLVLLLIIAVGHSNATLSLAYCSSENTGSTFSPVKSLYQSNGACFETCKANYALAVVQGNTCWCSNYLPADTVSVDSCDEVCPGFGPERCGSSSKGLFGYIALDKSPSGTAGGTSSTQSSNSPSTDPDSVQGSSTVVSNRSSTGFPPASSSPPILVATPSPFLPSTTLGPFSSFGAFSSLGRPSSLRPFPLGPSTFSSLYSPSPSTSTFIRSTFSSLTTSVQTSSADPSPVTVVQTVTASPLVRTSIVSIEPSTSAAATTTAQQTSTSSTSTTTSTSATSSTTPITSTTSVIPTIPAIPVPVTHPTSATPPPSTADTSSWTPTPVTSLLTVTGQVKTITITPTQPPKATNTAQPANSDGGFLTHPGRVAGLFVGLGLLIFVATAGSILYCLRRYHRRPVSPAAESEPDDDLPQRRPSRMSQMGLIAGGRGPLGEKIISPIQTSDWGPASSTKSPDTNSSPLDKRRSFPLIVDQRLDPGTLWSPHHDNDSRISIRSLQDDQDYSRRMLRVANPDH